MAKNKSLALILALLVLFASANIVCAVEVVKTVPYTCPPLLVYDSYKGAVWVTPNYLSEYILGVPFYASTNTIIAVSDNDSSVLANITLGGGPVAYDSVQHEVYVTDGDIVSVISDESNSVVATINPNTTLPQAPSCMVYDSGKGEIFAINRTSGVNFNYGIIIISCVTRQVVASIPLEDYPTPQGLTYDSAKGEIYVSYLSDPHRPENYVSVISDSNNSVIATIPLGNSTRYVGPGAYDSATGEIYLPTGNDAILVVSDKTHTIIDSIACPRSPGIGSFRNIAYDPVKSVIFVGALDGKTRIISDRTRSVVETLPVYSEALVYDSGQNVMISMSDRAIQFISDASLPDPPPTPTPTPTASPSPSTLQNPVFPDLDWVQIAILVTMVLIVVAVVVAAFMFLRKEGAQGKRS
jgi:hypothetical protein